MWYIMDNLEIVSEGYETEQEAKTELKLWIEEIYFLDYYPNPYVEYLEEDYFNIEDFEYELYKWAEDSMLPTREKKVKVRREWK